MPRFLFQYVERSVAASGLATMLLQESSFERACYWFAQLHDEGISDSIPDNLSLLHWLQQYHDVLGVYQIPSFLDSWSDALVEERYRGLLLIGFLDKATWTTRQGQPWEDKLDRGDIIHSTE